MNGATSGASLRPQSLLPVGSWSGLAAQSCPFLSHFVTYSLIFSRYPDLEATALLNSKGQLVVSATTENTARLPSYHWSNPVSINTAFQNQEKERTGQLFVRRAENMTTAGFPFKTLKVPSAFWQWFDAPIQDSPNNPALSTCAWHNHKQAMAGKVRFSPTTTVLDRGVMVLQKAAATWGQAQDPALKALVSRTTRNSSHS